MSAVAGLDGIERTPLGKASRSEMTQGKKKKKNLLVLVL